MSRWFTSLAVAGSAALLSACVYYPHGPYGPGYGPYHPGYDQPPPNADYGPPPQNDYPPPPPPRQQQGYAPQGQYSQPQGQYGQQPGPSQDESQGPTRKQIAHMNDPAWCSAHQRKCEKLQSRYGQGRQPEQGPPPDQGPPPGQS